MPRPGGTDRGIYERKITCPDCAGRCPACKGTRRTCPDCPCKTCRSCNGTAMKGTGEWWALYYIGKERHREIGPTKTAARRIYEKRQTEIRMVKFDPASVGRQNRPLLRDVIRDYLKESGAVKRSWKDDARYGKRWTDLLGEKRLEDVKPADIETWRREKLADGASPATVNRHVAFLKRVYNVAIRDELCEVNPASRVRKLVENNARSRYLLPDEETALRAALTERWWAFLAVLMMTGLRMGDLLSLRWENVDLTAGVLTIPRPKSGEKRHLPINAIVRAILSELPRRSEWVYPGHVYTGGSRVEGQKPKPAAKAATDRKELPWEGFEGGGWRMDPARHLSYSTFRNVWLRALEKAGLKDRDLRPHDLRHTFASRLVMKGTDLRTVQELMGHKTITMTQRYSHLSPSHLRDAVERLTDAP